MNDNKPTIIPAEPGFALVDFAVYGGKVGEIAWKPITKPSNP